MEIQETITVGALSCGRLKKVLIEHLSTTGGYEYDLFAALQVRNRSSVVEFLVERGISGTAPALDGRSALRRATSSRRGRGRSRVNNAGNIVEMLLTKGADPYAHIGYGDAPARRALRTDSYPVVKIMRDFLENSGQANTAAEPVLLSKERKKARTG